MRPSFQILLIILVISLVTAISYLTVQDLQRQREVFRVDIDSVLSFAIRNEFDARTDTLADLFINDLMDSTIVDIDLGGSNTGVTVFHFRDPGDNGIYTSMSMPEYADEEPVWTPAIRTGFYKKMRDRVKKDLNENVVFYWTDTLGTRLIRSMDALPIDTLLFERLVDEKKKASFIFSDHQLAWLPDTIMPSLISGKAIQTTKSLPYQINGEYHTVYLTFSNPLPDLLRRIFSTILGSLALLGITLFTFAILYRTLIQQRKLMALKDDFIDNITHELQTPITALRMANESLERLDPNLHPERRKKYLQIFNLELDRLSNLIDRLLQRNWQKKSMQWTRMNVKGTIQAVEQHVLISNQKAIKVNYLSGPELMIWSDPELLDIILENILQNSAKYSDEEGVNIDISWEQKNGYTLISIADDGWGIPHEDRKQIFEKFSRATDNQRNYAVKGLGIGLYHTRKNLEALGGHCTVQSNKPKGSIFTIHLPHHEPNTSR